LLRAAALTENTQRSLDLVGAPPLAATRAPAARFAVLERALIRRPHRDARWPVKIPP